MVAHHRKKGRRCVPSKAGWLRHPPIQPEKLFAASHPTPSNHRWIPTVGFCQHCSSKLTWSISAWLRHLSRLYSNYIGDKIRVLRGTAFTPTPSYSSVWPFLTVLPHHQQYFKLLRAGYNRESDTSIYRGLILGENVIGSWSFIVDQTQPPQRVEENWSTIVVKEILWPWKASMILLALALRSDNWGGAAHKHIGFDELPFS